MTIRVDVTEYSTVVRCSECSTWHWAGAGGDRAGGHRAAVEHERSVHPGETRAHEAAKAYAKSSPARAKNLPPPGGLSPHGIAGDDGGHRVGDNASRLLPDT